MNAFIQIMISHNSKLRYGFYDVVPEPLLAVFDFQEVELLFHGLPNIDMDDWMRNTEYTGEFSGQANHKVPNFDFNFNFHINLLFIIYYLFYYL